MSTLADYVVARLSAVLPLASRQAALPSALRAVHRTILRSLVDHGTLPDDAQLAAIAPGHDPYLAVWTLAANDLVVVDAHGRLTGAYPLTTERTPHVVTLNCHQLRAMCAFDALSVAPMFDTRAVVRSRCPITGEAIEIVQEGSWVVTATPSLDVQVGVWWRDPGTCAARSFCPGVVFLRDRQAAERWQAGRGADHDFAGLDDTVEAGARFFRPLLSEGAEREVPAAH